MIEELKNNITKFSNERLCEIIVSSRYLNIMKDEAIICMEELAKRRENGDNFDFENFIENEIKKLPNFNLDLENILKKYKVK